MSALFDRCPSEFLPVVDAARALIPPAVARLVEPQFLCGISPSFVGLHRFKVVEYEGITVSYDESAHASLASRSPDGRGRVVFPDLSVYPDPVATILHEIGHLFDEATGFGFEAPATTPYSRTNRRERFAEAFELLLRPPSTIWRELMEHAESMRPLRELVLA